MPVTGQVPIGALASTEVISGNMFASDLLEDLYVISTDISGQVITLTAGEGDPSDVHIAHGDYSVAEIAEKLNVSLLGPGSKIEQEQSRRLVRKVGTLLPADGVLATNTNLRLFGKTGSADLRTKVKFVVQSGKNLKMCIHNRSGSVYTTGAIFRWSGTIYGKWIL